MVFVLDRKKRPLMPCTEKRARLLLQRRRAVVVRRQPFTIRLKDRLVEESVLQPVVLKIDPGSKITGVAVVREEAILNDHLHHALVLIEIRHRGDAVRARMRQRAAYRRRRRCANLRYRACRFDNRKRRKLWLAPSLRSRLDNVLLWTRRIACVAPVTRVEVEWVRFDVRVLQGMVPSRIEYQRADLLGFELREYLLQKWEYQCAYCGTTGVSLEKEHIVPKSRGGTNRLSNLSIACSSCNEAKGNRTAAEFGHPEVQAQAEAPLRDAAAVDAIGWEIIRGLRTHGFSVRTWSGGRTKWNRKRFGIAKTHALDALCVGDVAGLSGSDVPILEIEAMGRGQRRRTNTDAMGFPFGYRLRSKRVRGFSTGDLVCVNMPRGKHAGVHIGRVAVRASGSFRVGQVDGISWRYCRLLERADGYGYRQSKGSGRSFSASTA
jgi:hypothetical protein